MAKGLLKSEVNKLLVEERKKMRAKAKESKFMQRTLNIYKNQVARAEELKVDPPDYTLEQFREYFKGWIGEACSYCETVLTVNNFVADHKNPISRGGKFTMENLAPCCKPCNCRKGLLTDDEYDTLNKVIESLPAEAAEDIRRRLTAGGKWIGRSF